MKLRKGEWFVLTGSLVIFGLAVVAGVLISIQPDRLHYVYIENEQTRHGETVYRREGCNACHTVFGNGYAYGPALDGVGSRRSADWLDRYLVAPWPGVSKRRYRTEMPAYDKMPEADRGVLVSYLRALRQAGGEALRP